MRWIDWMLAHEPQLRLAAFAVVFLAMATWEWRAPCRPLTLPRRRRWPHNLGLTLLDGVVLRLLFPAAGVGVAAWAGARGWGLLRAVDLAPAAAAAVAVVALDFVVYLQHRVMHAVPLLWRLHRVHHADLDYDVTTGARFHPLEIVLSMLVKAAAIVLVGAGPGAVLAFEVLLNATAMFNHGNVRLPAVLDGALRLLLVTPDMHRVHHSTDAGESNRNFGFNLPWWDRLLASYQAAPRQPHERMAIGLAGCRDPARVNRLDGMLAMPWRGDGPP